MTDTSDKARMPFDEYYRWKRRQAKKARANLENVWNYFGGRCFYCGNKTAVLSMLDDRKSTRVDKFRVSYRNERGEEVIELIATVDHFVPLSKRGDSKFSNLRLACVQCNGKKGSKLVKA